MLRRFWRWLTRRQPGASTADLVWDLEEGPTTAPPAAHQDVVPSDPPPATRAPGRTNRANWQTDIAHPPFTVTTERPQSSSPSKPSASAPRRARRWERVQDLSALRLGSELGSGGQGSVYEIRGRHDVVFKKISSPAPDLTSFSALAGVGPRIRSAVGGLPIDIAWPEVPVADRGRMVGYLMQRIPPGYFFDYTHRLRTSLKLRELQYAIERPSAFALPFTVTDSDRVRILGLIAEFLAAMHEEGVVYGDFSLNNVVFLLEPDLRVMVYDLDSARLLGQEWYVRQKLVQTVDWRDDDTDKRGFALLDADRYKFAVLVLRFLVDRSLSAVLRVDLEVPDLEVFQEHERRHLELLLRRAAGPTGTRPHLVEWLSLLRKGGFSASQSVS